MGQARLRTVLPELPDDVIDALVCQAMATTRNNTPKDKIRELVNLVRYELQCRLATREYNAERNARPDEKQRRARYNAARVVAAE